MMPPDRSPFWYLSACDGRNIHWRSEGSSGQTRIRPNPCLFQDDPRIRPNTCLTQDEPPPSQGGARRQEGHPQPKAYPPSRRQNHGRKHSPPGEKLRYSGRDLSPRRHNEEEPMRGGHDRPPRRAMVEANVLHTSPMRDMQPKNRQSEYRMTSRGDEKEGDYVGPQRHIHSTKEGIRPDHVLGTWVTMKGIRPGTKEGEPMPNWSPSKASQESHSQSSGSWDGMKDAEWDTSQWDWDGHIGEDTGHNAHPDEHLKQCSLRQSVSIRRETQRIPKSKIEHQGGLEFRPPMLGMTFVPPQGMFPWESLAGEERKSQENKEQRDASSKFSQVVNKEVRRRQADSPPNATEGPAYEGVVDPEEDKQIPPPWTHSTPPCNAGQMLSLRPQAASNNPSLLWTWHAYLPVMHVEFAEFVNLYAFVQCSKDSVTCN